VPRSKKQSRAIPLLSLRAFVACKKRENYNYKTGNERLKVTLKSFRVTIVDVEKK
jgi:hypothetical protein